MSPSSEHESVSYYIGLLVAVFAEETEVDVYGVGSTTFKRADVQRGFEPDACFYVRNAEQVRGKARIDLDVEPPPDLVVEVDITNPSLEKLPIYAQTGVSEVWRYDGNCLSFFTLEDGGYSETEESIVLPSIISRVASDLVGKSKSLELVPWLREVREAARQVSG